MFGKNEIVGQKFFSEAGANKLFVTSIFFTLQGEGPFRGYPAVFVRLAKCNLKCSFCDTFFDGGDWLSFSDIDQRISNTIEQYYKSRSLTIPQWAKDRRMVLVMTGGEPMLQKNIGDFLSTVGATFEHTQIESNGTVYQEIPDDTVLVISPKCSEKNGSPVKYLNPRQEVLDRADCLKFVMESNSDSPYSTIPDFAVQWKNKTGKTVFVSPMNIYNREPQKSKELRGEKQDNVTLEERSYVDEVIEFWEEGLLDMKANEKNHKYAANYCIQNGCVLNLQIHLYAGLA